MSRLTALILVGACQPPDLPPDAADPGAGLPDDAAAAPRAVDVPRVADHPLEVRFLGVAGVALRHGDDLVLTAPMFSNPGFFEVTLGDIAPQPALVDDFLPAEADGAGAILVGHAHYDHLLDVPLVQERVGGAPVYGNLSMAHLIGGVSGEVVAVNDPAEPRVDTRMCPDPDPCTGGAAGQEGSWLAIPGTQVRIRALCSMHPPQFLDLIHFAEGCVDTTWDEPPARADDWLEGATLAWLIDFLDDAGRPVHRVYYQDAPSDGPAGLVHPSLLADKGIDLAVLNVGNYDAVRDHPGEPLTHLDPRYVIGAHWEDFFRTQHAPIAPIPFHAPPEGFDARVDEAMIPSVQPPVTVDGVTDHGRYWRPLPGTGFVFPPGS